MSSEIKIITEKDFFVCESGLMPARLQSRQSTAVKEDGQFRYITSNDVCTQSCIDFSCSKLMLLMAAVAALAAAFIALCVATGGAAAVAMTCIVAGAAAGAGGAALGGIYGSLICGQKAAPARKWMLSKQDFTIHGITVITSEHIMVCTVFSFVGLPPQQIRYAPDVQSWGQAIAQGVTGFVGKVFEGLAIGACIGACVGGGRMLLTSGSWANAGRTALQFLKSIPGNFGRNYLATLGRVGSWSSKGIKIAAGVRGAMGVLGAAQSYGETGELFSTDTLAGFGKGIIGIELGLATSVYNLFTPKRSWSDVCFIVTMMLPFIPKKQRPRVKDLAYEAPKPQFEMYELSDGTQVKRLKPNYEYESNGYKYKTDAQGRIIQVEGELQFQKGGRKPYDQRTVGKGDGRLAGDQGGHLIGDQFGGSGGKENLVPMDADVNNYHKGEWGQMEKRWASELEQGSTVDVKIEPQYGDGTSRPTHFEITETINGETNKITIQNESP